MTYWSEATPSFQLSECEIQANKISVDARGEVTITETEVIVSELHRLTQRLTIALHMH